MNDPKKYGNIDDKQRTIVSELVKEFYNELKAMHGKILDIGCGPGRTTRELIIPQLPDDAVVVGVDTSPEMLKDAEENYCNERRLSFFQLNIETTELPKNLTEYYDNAVSFFCLHWCKNPEIACNNIYKLLKPGGTVLLVCASYHITFDIFSEQMKKSKYSVYMQNSVNPTFPQYDLSNPEETLKLYMKKAGFEISHCTNRQTHFIFENINFLMDFIRPLTPCLKEMPDELKEDYMNDVKKIITKRHLINNNANEFPVFDKCSFIVTYCKKT